MNQRLGLLLTLISLGPYGTVMGQNSGLRGFVVDAESGQPLENAQVFLERAGSMVRGTVTNRDGLYRMAGFPGGTYVFSVRFVGFTNVTDTLTLEPGRTYIQDVSLVPERVDIDEVVIQSERSGGAARIIAGQTTVRPEDMARIPTLDLSADMASYLSSQPGVVTTGDRGGQFFIRGGEPTQNLVQLDGMTIYQPFHLLGFYSVLPAEMLNKVDLYAGGFGSRFGQRISTVIDAYTRDGDKRRLGGSMTLSPFVNAVHLEGPIVPDHASVLAQWRRSAIRQVADPVLNHRMPYDFGDFLGKIQVEPGKKSRISITGLTSFDRGRVSENLDSVRAEDLAWQNRALGIRWFTLPKATSMTFEMRLSYSDLVSAWSQEGSDGRRSSVADVQFAGDANYLSPRWEVNAGWSTHVVSTRSRLGGAFQNIKTRGLDANSFAFYIDAESIHGNFRIRPGMRVELQSSVIEPTFEPRLRMIYKRGVHTISAATGLYYQPIIGITDQRDAASVFTTWFNIPRLNTAGDSVLVGHLPRALHALVGYRFAPSDAFVAAVEGYRKWLDNLFVAEWTMYPSLTTKMQRADGAVAGFDLRLEGRRQPFYATVTYGLSSTRYSSLQKAFVYWSGGKQLVYRPAHDRRHQINTLLSYERGGFTASFRWEFGSGLPFSMPLGFDGFVLMDNIDIVPGVPVSRRVIYDEPFNAELPTYHRMDLSVQREWRGRHASFTLMASAINVYDRRNIFYVDVYTMRRSDQLPFIPSIGLKVLFR